MDDADLDDLISSDNEMSILSSLTSDDGNAKKRSKGKGNSPAKQTSKSKNPVVSHAREAGVWDRLDPRFQLRQKLAAESNKRPKASPLGKRAAQNSPARGAKRSKRKSGWNSDSEHSLNTEAAALAYESDVSDTGLQKRSLRAPLESSPRRGNLRSLDARTADRSEAQRKSYIEPEDVVDSSSLTSKSSANAEVSVKCTTRSTNSSERSGAQNASRNKKSNRTKSKPTATKRDSIVAASTETSRSLRRANSKSEVPSKSTLNFSRQSRTRSKDVKSNSSARKESTKRLSSSRLSTSIKNEPRVTKSKPVSAIKTVNRSSAKKVNTSALSPPKTKRPSSSVGRESEGAYRPYSPRHSSTIASPLWLELEAANAATNESHDPSELPSSPTGALFDSALDSRLKKTCEHRQAALNIIQTAQETLDSVVEVGTELSEASRTILFHSILRELRLRKAEILVERLNQNGYLDFDDDEEWDVEEIVDVEDQPDGSRSYWIKWVGWRTLTLEPADKLTHCSKLVNDFEDRRAGRRHSQKGRNTASDLDAERSRQKSQIDAFLRVVRDKYKWTAEMNLVELHSILHDINRETVGEFPRERPAAASRKRSKSALAPKRQGLRDSTKSKATNDASSDEEQDSESGKRSAQASNPDGDVDDRRKTYTSTTVLKNGRKCLTHMSKKQARGQREVARKFLREFEARIKRVYPQMCIRVENEVDNEVPPAHYEYITEYKVGEDIISAHESPIWCECPNNCWPVAAAPANGNGACAAACASSADNGSDNGPTQPSSVSTTHSHTAVHEPELTEVEREADTGAPPQSLDMESGTDPAAESTGPAIAPATIELTATESNAASATTTKRKRGFDTPLTCCPANGAKVLGVDPSCAYDRNKRVNWEPGVVIFECGKKCKCDTRCPNRVVQLGSKVRLCVFRTVDRGWGVKTLQYIPAGRFVIEYLGEVITNEEADRRGRNYDDEGLTFLFDLDLNDEDRSESSRHYTVDAKHCGNITHFLNHSCDPNLAVYNVFIDSVDPALPRLALFATRAINAGEELTFDYQRGKQLDDSVMHVSGPISPHAALSSSLPLNDVGMSSVLEADADTAYGKLVESIEPFVPSVEEMTRGDCMESSFSSNAIDQLIGDIDMTQECQNATSAVAPINNTLKDMGDLTTTQTNNNTNTDLTAVCETIHNSDEMAQAEKQVFEAKSCDADCPTTDGSPQKIVVEVTKELEAKKDNLASRKQQHRMKCLCKAANCRGWLF